MSEVYHALFGWNNSRMGWELRVRDHPDLLRPIYFSGCAPLLPQPEEWAEMLIEDDGEEMSVEIPEYYVQQGNSIAVNILVIKDKSWLRLGGKLYDHVTRISRIIGSVTAETPVRAAVEDLVIGDKGKKALAQGTICLN